MGGETALHYLTVESFAEGIRFLVENSFDVDAMNDYGDTPFARLFRKIILLVAGVAV